MKRVYKTWYKKRYRYRYVPLVVGTRCSVRMCNDILHIPPLEVNVNSNIQMNNRRSGGMPREITPTGICGKAGGNEPTERRSEEGIVLSTKTIYLHSVPLSRVTY